LRIGCATALYASGASVDDVKRICRWRSDASATIYSRMDFKKFSALVTKAADAEGFALNDHDAQAHALMEQEPADEN